MPPELIITPAHQGKTTDESDEPDNKEKIPIISELPPIAASGTTKRNHIWHNFKKCVPTLR